MLQKDLAGVTVIEPSYDDVSDFCSHGPFPLLSTIADELDVTKNITMEGRPIVAKPPITVCYYPTEADKRPRSYKLKPHDVPVDYCSYVVWTYATIGQKLVWPATESEKRESCARSSLLQFFEPSKGMNCDDIPCSSASCTILN